MNKGGTIDFDFCTVTMVFADHSCGSSEFGGDPVGYVIKVNDYTIYHAGKTNVFGDMSIISELYAPTHALLPIEGRYTMGTNEAAYAVCKLLRSVNYVMPMSYEKDQEHLIEELEKCIERWRGAE